MRPLKITQSCLKTSRTEHRVTWLHIPEEWGLNCTAARAEKFASSYEGVSKIFRTDAVKIINLTTKRVWKLPTSTQLRATWHNDSLDMVVLPSTGASRYHKCCIDGGTSPEYFGFTLVFPPPKVGAPLGILLSSIFNLYSGRKTKDHVSNPYTTLIYGAQTQVLWTQLTHP
jgi:hypothetical protein